MADGIVAILFTDLVGSTSLYDRLGDGVADAVRRDHFALLRHATAAAGGEEVKSLGDGLMVVFASAVSAVDAAVAIQQAVAAAPAAPVRQQVRVGIHVGEPLVDANDYYGVNVNIARRLCDTASAGQILVSDVVRALVRSRSDHELRPVGELTLKGIDEPVAGFEVVWTAPASAGAGAVPFPPPLSSALSGASLLVGRDDALALLRAAHKAAVDGPQLALLRGEPGIGKTRLAAEAARSAADDDGAVVLFGRCDEEPLTSYQPFVEAAGQLAAHLSTADMAAALGPAAPSLAHAVPAIAAAVGTGGDRGEVDRGMLFDGFARLAALAAERGAAPAMVILDDVHWADAPTLVLLLHLLTTSTAPVLYVATYRDTELSRTHPLSAFLADWRRVRPAGGARIDVGGLDADDVARLVFDGGVSAIAPLLDAIARETEGNPFFALEIGQHLIETGQVSRRTDGEWEARPGATVELPEGVVEVIGRRLSRLSDECNATLAVASVIGRSFDLDALAAVTGRPEGDVLADVEEALRAGVVTEAIGSLDRFTFSHALIRTALHDELALSRRVRLHAAIGQVLQRRGADPAEVAHHLLQSVPATSPVTAGAWAYRAAAHAAYDLAAFEDAAALAERGIDVLTGVDGGVAVAGDTPSDGVAATTVDGLRCDLLLTRSDALCSMARKEEGIDAAVAAAGLAAAVGDAHRMARAAIIPARAFGSVLDVGSDAIETAASLLLRALDRPDLDPVDRARLLSLRYWYNGLGGGVGVEEAYREARAIGDAEALMYALLSRADWLSKSPGRAEEQLDLLDEVDGLALPARLRPGYLAAASRRVHVRLRVGPRDALDAAVERHRDLTTASRMGLWAPYAQMFDAMVALIDGDLSDAERHAMAVVASDPSPLAPASAQAGAVLLVIARERDQSASIQPLIEAAIEAVPHVTTYRAVRAVLLSDVGDRDSAIRELDGLLPALASDTAVGVGGTALALEAAAAVGVLDVVEGAIDGLRPGQLEGASAGGVPLGPVGLYLGIGLQALGRHAEALDALDAAAELAEQMRSPLWAVQVDVARASVLAASGGQGAATLRDSARARAAELGLARQVRRCDELAHG